VTETIAALLGAGIGALAGLAGGGLAALAAVRASQVAARAPLGAKLHTLSRRIIRLQSRIGTSEEDRARRDIEYAWNDFLTHQRILCPSEAVEVLAYIVRRSTKESGVPVETWLTISGSSQERITRIVAAHSNHLFRFRAKAVERDLMEEWLLSPHGLLIDAGMRQKIAADLQLSRKTRRALSVGSRESEAPRPDPSSTK
jgi:hypothetical protein